MVAGLNGVMILPILMKQEYQNSDKMKDIPQETLLSEFATDTYAGLSSNPKYLSSKYFYDGNGSEIFQDIMQMPEYYLTGCELEIFTNSKQQILDSFQFQKNNFELIELGAGDGTKTKVLLSHFLEQKTDFKYSPIDISDESIINLVNELKEELPNLKVKGLIGDYFELIKGIQPNEYSRKVFLFLGSNIGNYNEQLSIQFLKDLKSVCNQNDYLFIGFDLKKDNEIILNAYNDPHGHTAAFNLNLLKRINRELDANFNLHEFNHQEVYNPESGTAISYLISKSDQTIEIPVLNKAFKFKLGEKIFMEMSQKYDTDMIKQLASRCGFEVVRNFFDDRQFFVNSLWKLK
jgi:L-histidine Nalpha-methyltransferase